LNDYDFGGAGGLNTVTAFCITRSLAHLYKKASTDAARRGILFVRFGAGW
jgi:hypothetical protein